MQAELPLSDHPPPATNTHGQAPIPPALEPRKLPLASASPPPHRPGPKHTHLPTHPPSPQAHGNSPGPSLCWSESTRRPRASTAPNGLVRPCPVLNRRSTLASRFLRPEWPGACCWRQQLRSTVWETGRGGALLAGVGCLFEMASKGEGGLSACLSSGRSRSRSPHSWG